jgi:hypothetical protein
VPGNPRRQFPFDPNPASLPRPLPGWDAEWIHLSHGPVSNEAMHATFGSGSMVANVLPETLSSHRPPMNRG